MTSTFRTFHMPENFYFDGMKSIEFESFQPSRQPVVIPRKKRGERMGRQEAGIYWLSFLFWAVVHALGIRRENLSAQQATENRAEK